MDFVPLLCKRKINPAINREIVTRFPSTSFWTLCICIYIYTFSSRIFTTCFWQIIPREWRLDRNNIVNLWWIDWIWREEKSWGNRGYEGIGNQGCRLISFSYNGMVKWYDRKVFDRVRICSNKIDGFFFLENRLYNS